MSSVSMEAIKQLRERTQAGMADCKSALVEASGDMDSAVEIILKKGLAKSAKRSGKVAAEGEIRTQVLAGAREAVIVEVNIETDFSARNEKFAALVTQAMSAAVAAPVGASFESLVYEGKTLSERAGELTAIVGEKITLRRFAKVAVSAGKSGFCLSYVHMAGKIGVLVALEAATDAAAAHEAARTFAEETAMQIAAMSPVALNRESVAADEVAKQRDIFAAQMREEAKPKPEAMWPKILDGKIGKWFGEVALMEQESAQHKLPIKALLEQAAVTAGAPLTVTAFVRYELGEGIEKQIDDLQKGVAELLQ
ncbi:MAG: translation elongation factor Ts [Myxococcales bacterium]|nr:translation elongation factor Ts [Myxococcales bacterium]